ncbi:MAG: arylsulfatase A-like enzyme [Planctomycetota bacterium]|jgi:arylsulfatase A-like enzyme
MSLKRILQWAVPIALVTVSCDYASPTIWVDRLPQQNATASSMDGRATWIDLLKLPVAGTEGIEVTLVDIKPPPPKESSLEEMQRGRSGVSMALSDQRRAWVAPLVKQATFEVQIEKSGRVRCGFAFFEASAKQLSEDVSLAFGIEFDSGNGRRGIARGRTNGVGQFQWLDLHGELPGPGLVIFTVTVEGVVPEDFELSAAFGMPTVQTDYSRVPDVVIVSVDTLRADRLGCYGYGRETSPNIDRLAARGVVFEQCLSQAPWTLPSYGSLFTSLYPAEHRAGISEKADIWTKGGVATDYSKLGQKLLNDVPTLAGELSAAGYRTASFYFNPYLGPQTGVARGFDEYAFLRYTAEVGVDRALDWLKLNEGLPRFLFLQLIDPHWPYAPPAPFDKRFANRRVEDIPKYPWGLPSIRNSVPEKHVQTLLSDLYDGEIAYTDSQLGRLFDYFEKPGTLDQSLLVFHSDHGEEFWEHGQFEHGHALHQELLRVPLILSMPKQFAPLRVADSVRSIDIFPTVMDLLGLKIPDGLRGSSLQPMVRGELKDVSLTGFAESILWGRPYAPFDEAKTLVTDDWKLVVGDGESPTSLYHLSEDPNERVNLATKRDEDVQRMQRRLTTIFEEARDGSVGEVLQLDEGQQEQLNNLGYTDSDELGEGSPDDSSKED